MAPEEVQNLQKKIKELEVIVNGITPLIDQLKKETTEETQKKLEAQQKSAQDLIALLQRERIDNEELNIAREKAIRDAQEILKKAETESQLLAVTEAQELKKGQVSINDEEINIGGTPTKVINIRCNKEDREIIIKALGELGATKTSDGFYKISGMSFEAAHQALEEKLSQIKLEIVNPEESRRLKP